MIKLFSKINCGLVPEAQRSRMKKKEGTTTAGEFNKKTETAIYPVFTLIFDVFMIKPLISQ